MIVDRKIIEGCISGKRLAQSKLYKVFSGVMLGVCLRYSTSTSEAEDILQEGFIKVFGSIKSLKNHEVIEGMDPQNYGQHRNQPLPQEKNTF